MFVRLRLHLPHGLPVSIQQVTPPHSLIKRSLFLILPPLFDYLFLALCPFLLPQHTPLPLKHHVRHDKALAISLYAHAKGR
jgi:hypothetical protein